MRVRFYPSPPTLGGNDTPVFAHRVMKVMDLDPFPWDSV